MYKARVGNSWVKNIIPVNENIYDIEFTTNRYLAKDLDYEDIRYILKDFDNVKIVKIEIKEIDVTDMIIMSL
jgi:hypothetical protein